MSQLRYLLIVILGLGSILGVSACSSTDPNPTEDHITYIQQSPNHVTAEFEGKCAMSVAKGVYSKLGKEDYRVDYRGKTYFFSSAEARDEFLDDIKANTGKAAKNWEIGRAASNRG